MKTFVLNELFYYKDVDVNEQFNTTIISLVIASLFQAFSFHNLTCNKRYAAFTWMVKEILEIFGT